MLLKFIWLIMKKKGKVTKILKDYGDYTLFVSYELRTIKGDASSELVKCKPSKTYIAIQLARKIRTYPVSKPDSRGVCRTCPTPSPDMSGPP
jgi:hypothetical protein